MEVKFGAIHSHDSSTRTLYMFHCCSRQRHFLHFANLGAVQRENDVFPSRGAGTAHVGQDRVLYYIVLDAKVLTV